MENNTEIRAKRIVWHDPNINNSENISYFQEKFNKNDLELERFSEYQQASNFLTNSQGKWIVITSGSKARIFLPLIKDLKNILGKIIFCSDVNLHKTWSQGLVDSVEDDIEKVIEKVNSIYDNFLLNSALKIVPTNTAVCHIHQVLVETTSGNEVHSDEPGTSSFLLVDEIDNKKFLAIVSIFMRYNTITPENVCKELVNLNYEERNQIITLFDEKKSDLLEAIVFIYTTNFVYDKMNRMCSEQNYKKLKFVLSCILTEIRKRPEVMIAKNVVLYRGLRNRKHISKYLEKKKGYWPSFTSTSTSLQVALAFAQSSGIVFEISLSSVNPHPHLRVPSNWSSYPNEEEVLMLPHFSLKVVSINEKNGRIWVKLEQEECDHAFSIDKDKFKEFWDKEIDNIVGVKAEEIIDEVSQKASVHLNAISIINDHMFICRWTDRLSTLIEATNSTNIQLKKRVDAKRAEITNEFKNFFQSYFRNQALKAIYNINSLYSFDSFIKEYTCEIERFMNNNMFFFDNSLKVFADELISKIIESGCDILEPDIIKYFLGEIIEKYIISFAEECITYQEKVYTILLERKSQHIKIIKYFLIDKMLYSEYI